MRFQPSSFKCTEEDFKHNQNKEVNARYEHKRSLVVAFHLFGLGCLFRRSVSKLGFVHFVVFVGLIDEEHHGRDDDGPRCAEHRPEGIVELSPHLERHVGAENSRHHPDSLAHKSTKERSFFKVHTTLRRLFGVRGLPKVMVVIRYAIAGQPVESSLSPLLTALVAAHLGYPTSEKHLKMELVEVSALSDALAWGYAGAVPVPRPWAYTGASIGTFRTSALLQKAVAAAMELEAPHGDLAPSSTKPYITTRTAHPGLPTRLFDEEIWLNLTSPLKHQLDSSAVVAVDTSMTTKSVNVLRWDGRGWWCAGVDGEGLRMVLHHHGFNATETVLGLCGGGGAARSTAATWVESGGQLHPLPSRRELDIEGLTNHVTERTPEVLVDFEDVLCPEETETLMLRAAYRPMEGSFEERVSACSSPCLDGRWLLAAQHLACWRHLWAPEHASSLPSLDLLLTRLVKAESLLAEYAN